MLGRVLEYILESDYWRILQVYMSVPGELTSEHIAMHVGVYHQVQFRVYLGACLGVHLRAF
jgi:hypothetical protein